MEEDRKKGTLSPENEIYFAKQDNGKESSELYESTFKEGKWSEPKKIIYVAGRILNIVV